MPGYEDKPLPFGKHKGELICDCPKHYLEWLIDQAWFQKEHARLFELIKTELKYRMDHGIRED